MIDLSALPLAALVSIPLLGLLLLPRMAEQTVLARDQYKLNRVPRKK